MEHSLKNEISVFLEPEALVEALRLARSRPDWTDLPLRLYLDGKGCDGFYYGVSFDALTQDDLTFPQKSGEEELLLITDKDTAQFVDGSVISWVNDERGTGFLVTNPNHKKFRGKFFRRGAWKKRLNSSQSGEGLAPPRPPMG